jgi:hypothetical protein
MGPENKAAANRRYDWQLFRLLITPSWLSILGSLLISAAITLFLLVQGQYEGSELQRQFLAWQQSADGGGSLMQAVTSQHYVAISKAVSTIQLFIFWYVVGLVLYALGSGIYGAVQEIRLIKNDLGYVNADRHRIFKNAAEQIARQLGALFAWLLLAIATLKVAVPYAFGTINIANEYLPSKEAVGLLLVTPVALAFLMHLHIVLIRLFLGRPRVWHSEESVETLADSNK